MARPYVPNAVMLYTPNPAALKNIAKDVISRLENARLMTPDHARRAQIAPVLEAWQAFRGRL
jgi:hypothetical protein